jgi:hypothetical protein
MFEKGLIRVWVGILVLSGMFLLGQDSWAPAECTDLDGDGYGNPASEVCMYPGLDCDDGNADVYPGAPELCDEVDNQCPGDVGYGEVDEGCYDPTYAQSMTVGDSFHWPMLQWTSIAEDLEDAITGPPDYSYDPGTGIQQGDAAGWNQGWGNYVLDFGELLEGDLWITFWHFGGYNHDDPPVPNNLVYMYVSDDGVNWTPTHVDFDPNNTDGYAGYPRGTAGDVQLEDVISGGEELFEHTYNLYDTFGVNSMQYLMIEKIDGGPKTGKFIDAVGVSPVEPEG